MYNLWNILNYLKRNKYLLDKYINASGNEKF